jgi:hypothetical protein
LDQFELPPVAAPVQVHVDPHGTELTIACAEDADVMPKTSTTIAARIAVEPLMSIPSPATFDEPGWHIAARTTLAHGG